MLLPVERLVDQPVGVLVLLATHVHHASEREARKEGKVDKVQEKRGKLRRKVDKAYAKFDQKLAEENRRFDDKRARILEK